MEQSIFLYLVYWIQWRYVTQSFLFSLYSVFS